MAQGSWLPVEVIPEFPPACACCLAPATEHLLVRSSFRAAESLLKPEDLPWRVPYCKPCVAHVEQAWARAGSLKRRWAMAAAFALIPGLIFHALLVLMILLFLAGTAIVLGIANARMRRVPTGPGCATPAPAVRRKGPDGARYHIGFANPAYRERFEAGR